MERETKFVDVILPLALPNLYTYRVPFELNEIVQVGQRAVVQFGKSKLYTAIVRNIHNKAPEVYQAKYLDSVLDDEPIICEEQFRLWEWISKYYMCHIGEVMNAALPGSLKLASESKLVLNPDFDRQFENLTDSEYLIAEALEIQKVLTITDVSEILKIKTIQPIIKSLIEKSILLVQEELKYRYKPKIEAYVRLVKDQDSEEALKVWMDQLQKAGRQLETLMAYLHLSQFFSGKIIPVKKIDLQKKANSDSSVVNKLVEKGLFEIDNIQVDRLKGADTKLDDRHVMNEDQEAALVSFKEQALEKDVILLHGVTGSGKTEVYIQLIEEALERGEQVLYLLPEIALTTQIISRLRKFFGNKIGVYHSKFNENERVEIWNKVLKGSKEEFSIILGARSSVFLPYQNLGLIIIDEEHETSFKQYDPAPRYHARDTAIVLATLHKAKVLLGSATPSIETFWNAKEGKFGFVEMQKRFGGLKLPEVFCADLVDEKKKRKMKSHFSSFLLKEMEETLELGEQIILFQNRRGYTPLWECEDCGHVPKCKSCDVSLTFHKKTFSLICHYCGYSKKPPKICDACGSNHLAMLGFGTEKIEEELVVMLPKAKIARMDLDTTRSKNAYQNLITDFEDRKIDVLIGTQMVTKGLDFDNVSLVGILSADTMLNFPDFRAFERSYQLMSQVAGRSGRKHKRGKVLVQTYNPNHWIIRKMMNNDYIGMYKQEIIERRNFHYPPFFRLIRISLKHKQKDAVDIGADTLSKMLKKIFGNRVLGPEEPMIPRIKNYYIKETLLKFERKASAVKVKSSLQEIIIDFQANPQHKGYRLVIDVDPI